MNSPLKSHAPQLNHNLNKDKTYVVAATNNNKPHFITQPEFNDLVRDLPLTKHQSEVLTSRLQHWILFDGHTRVAVYKTRSADLQ